jgi:hypothetical protein
MNSTLCADDMRRVIGFLPKDLIKLMRAHPIYLAGGYLRARIAGEQVNDIDLFCDSAGAAETYSTALAAQREVKPYRTRNAFTVIAPPRLPVQFIHRWTFADAASLIESFDFTVAMAAIWFDRTSDRWLSATSPHFYPDLASKRLRYSFPQRNEDAGGSLLRVQKFLGRGYHIAPEEFGKVIARLVGGVNPDTKFWEAGEVERAAVLVGLLRQADPLTVIDGLTPSDDSLDAPVVPEPIADDPLA